MSKDAGFGAIIALVGAFIGALLSILPLYLFEARDAAARNLTVVELLKTERRSAISYCVAMPVASSARGATNAYALASIVAAAWQSASAQGEFVDSLDVADWEQIADAYSSLAAVQGSVNYYSVYTPTQGAMSNYQANLFSLLSGINALCSETETRFSNLDSLFDKLQARFEHQTQELSATILLLVVAGLAIFIVATKLALQHMRPMPPGPHRKNDDSHGTTR